MNKLEALDSAAMTSSNVTYGGAVTTAGSGAVVFWGHTLTQVEIALWSMIVGAIIGVLGLLSNIFFKYLAHRETCRVNRANESKPS